MITSSVIMKNGNPTLVINGECVPENAYITYFRKKARYDDFAEAGYKLYSVPLYFATRGITEYNEIPPFDDGVFEGDLPDYSIIDRAFEDILKVCPDAYIFPRVNMSLPLSWERENPEELCDWGNISMDKRRPCHSSDKWAEETKRLLGLFIDHIENSPYRDRVCAYQLAGGNAEEWFGLDQRGSIGKRSREKFEEYKTAHSLVGTEEEYYRFLSEITADRIIEFSTFAKEKTGGRLAIGSFYGYTFERVDRESDHHALDKVLRSDSVDFLCSPVSYMNVRECGHDHPCMLPLESLKLHGKLYFMENDARTHLTAPLFDIPHFHNPHYEPRPRWHTVETLKMYYSRALIKGHALWWFDMGGGWYHYPLYMQMMKEFLEITKEAKKKDLSGVSEVAVLIDEHSLSAFSPEERVRVAKPVCYAFREQLGKVGAPYDSYLATDFDMIKDKYRAFVIMAPKMTAELESIIAACDSPLVVTEANCNMTVSELREYLKSRGVHLYTEDDAVVYVNKSYLFLHTVKHGRVNISMPDGKKLRRLLGDEVDPASDILPEKTSYLFEVE